MRRYLQAAIRRAIREHNLIWRQGKRSLFSGSMLFFIGIALSYAFHPADQWEIVVGGLLGNGVFLVVAWVGLWYPLDLLFIAREQAKREIRVLGRHARRAGRRPGPRPDHADSRDASSPVQPGVAAQPECAVPQVPRAIQIGALDAKRPGAQRPGLSARNYFRSGRAAWIAATWALPTVSV